MHLSTVETVLEYQVQAPTHFCFNIEAAHWPTQKILSERLAVSSGVDMHSFTDESSGNRFIRFNASPGPLLVNYKADVEVYSEQVDERLPESPVGEVPPVVAAEAERIRSMLAFAESITATLSSSVRRCQSKGSFVPVVS